MRSFDRGPEQARPLSLDIGYTRNADGSILISCGHTKVICTAFLEERTPPFLKNTGKGWVTAEYGMLPGSTHSRTAREAARGKQSGRTVEISRLIGRCLRACVDNEALGERSITVDCDVIQADGGTRTAAISGGCLALLICLWKHRAKFRVPPVVGRVAAISLGILKDEVLVDLDYKEDSAADVDLNLVMTHEGNLVEIQGTAEGAPFTRADLDRVVDMGASAIQNLHDRGRKALETAGVGGLWIP